MVYVVFGVRPEMTPVRGSADVRLMGGAKSVYVTPPFREYWYLVAVVSPMESGVHVRLAVVAPYVTVRSNGVEKFT
jgi:hypothetical protein